MRKVECFSCAVRLNVAFLYASLPVYIGFFPSDSFLLTFLSAFSQAIGLESSCA